MGATCPHPSVNQVLLFKSVSLRRKQFIQRILKLQAGEVDAIIFVPFNRVAELDADPNINVHLDSSSRMDHMLVNHANAPLDDVRVRQALYHAIDR